MCVCARYMRGWALCGRFVQQIQTPQHSPSLCSPLSLSLSPFSLALTPSFSLSGGIDPLLSASEAPVPHVGCRCCVGQSWDVCDQFLLCWLLLLLLLLLIMSLEAPQSRRIKRCQCCCIFCRHFIKAFILIYFFVFNSFSLRITVPECCLFVEPTKKWRTTTARVHFR